MSVAGAIAFGVTLYLAVGGGLIAVSLWREERLLAAAARLRTCDRLVLARLLTIAVIGWPVCIWLALRDRDRAMREADAMSSRCEELADALERERILRERMSRGVPVTWTSEPPHGARECPHEEKRGDAAGRDDLEK